MASPYDAVVKKYAASATPAAPDPSTLPKIGGTGVFKNVPVLPAGPMDKLPDTSKPAPFKVPAAKVDPSLGPYAAVASKYKTAAKQAQFDAGDAVANKAIDELEHPSLGRQVLDVAKGLPGGMLQVGKELVTHPIKSGQAIVGGLMDVGPAAVNTADSIGRGILDFIGGRLGPTQSGGIFGPGTGGEKPINLPLPGQTFHDYVGGSDENAALGAGAEQFSAFELGQRAAVGATGGPAAGFVRGAAQDALGNVAGGQVILPPGTSLQDRAKAAAFDAAFAVGTKAAGKTFGVVRGFKRAPELEAGAIDTGAPVVKSDIPEAAAPSKVKVTKAPPHEPAIGDIVYKPKTDLGVDPSGEKVLATTHYDNRTGRAIVYYDKSLDLNPELRTTVLDHEEGHVLDKRVNGGNNLSAELQNPSSGSPNMDNVLGPFAKQTKQTVEEAATKLQADIQTLSEGKGSTPGELFANAYAKYRQDVALAKEKAPTFASFMNHTPVLKEGPIVERSVTGGQISSRVRPEPAGKPLGPRAARDAQGGAQAPVKLSRRVLAKVNPKSDIPPIKKGGRLTPTEKKVVENPFPKRKEATAKLPAKEAPISNKVVAKPGFKQKIVGKASKNDLVTLYHGTSKEAAAKIRSEGKIKDLHEQTHNEKAPFDRVSLTDNLATAREYGDTVVRVRVPRSSVRKVADGEYAFDGKELPLSPKQEGSTIRTAPPKLTPKPTPGTGLVAGTGLRTGKGVNTRSFNPDKINAPSEVQDLFDKLGADNKNFASQRLSKGNEDIRDLARLTGLTEDELLAAKPGSIANSETTTAARQLVLDKANKLMNTLKGIDVAHATPSQLRAIRDDFVQLTAMQKTVAGFRTEASNVFRSLGLELMPGENATLAELASLLKKEGLASEDDAALFASRVPKIMALSKLDTIREGVLSTWYSSILSGPKTSVRNILSTGSNILTELAVKTANPKQWREIMPAISGMVRGFRMGKAEALEVLRGGPTVTKFMETGGTVGQPEVFSGKWARYGQVVESVGRFLNAQDRFLAAGAREMERASLKVHSEPVSQAVEDAVSKAYAERTVYHGKPTGRLIGAIRDAAQALRKRSPWTKFFIPFVDTVANVMDRQFDYIPLTAALRLRDSVITEQAERIVKDYELKASDLPFIKQRIFDQQVGRLALGSAISTGAIVLAGAGRVSGVGPTNTGARAELTRTGWRPNSIKIGDTWVPYVYLGPLAGILSMAGNVHDKVAYDSAPGKSLTSLLSNGMIGWVQTQLNQSFLSGVADIFDVATGNLKPETYITNFASGLIPIPAAYSQTKDMIFRQQYETHGIVEKLRAKLGLTGDVFGSGALQPKLDAFGEPMSADLIFGVTPSAEKFTPVDRFLTANDLAVTKPSAGQLYSVPGQGKTKRALSEEEYTQYIQDSGKQIYESLQKRLPTLEKLPADAQKNMVQSTVDDIRTRVRKQILLKSGSKAGV